MKDRISGPDDGEWTPGDGCRRRVAALLLIVVLMGMGAAVGADVALRMLG